MAGRTAHLRCAPRARPCLPSTCQLYDLMKSSVLCGKAHYLLHPNFSNHLYKLHNSYNILLSEAENLLAAGKLSGAVTLNTPVKRCRSQQRVPVDLLPFPIQINEDKCSPHTSWEKSPPRAQPKVPLQQNLK